MIRQPQREQANRLMVKTLDQVFIARAREGLGCSCFAAQALTELVKEVYFPWLSQPEAIQAGKLAMTVVSADEPGTNPWRDARWCRSSCPSTLAKKTISTAFHTAPMVWPPCVSGRLSAWPMRPSIKVGC